MPATNLGWLLDQNPPVFQVYGTKRKSTCLGPPSTEMDEAGSIHSGSGGPDNGYKRHKAEYMKKVYEAQQKAVIETFVYPYYKPGALEKRNISVVHLAAKRICARSEPVSQNEMNQYMDFTSDHQFSIQNPLPQCNLLCQKQQPVDLTQCPVATPIFDATMNTLPSMSVPEQEHQELIENNNNSDNNNNTSSDQLMSQFQHAVEQNDMVMNLDHETYTFIPVQVGDRQNDEACSSMESEGATDPSQYSSTAYCDNFCVGGDYSPTSGNVRCLCRPSWEGLLDVRPYVSDYY